jgi:hypothetical protein
MNRFAVSALAAVAALSCAAPAAQAHKADPNFLTRVDAVTPATRGITMDVINRDDQLQLTNRSGKDVTIEGYSKEPYARVLGDGTVEVNTNSPAYYLNDDRYAVATVPKGIDGKGAPHWKQLDKTGRFQWHDHRMHWMAKTRPPSVKDPDVRQKVFTWTVPIDVAGRGGTIAGTLFWTPRPGGSMPIGALAGGVAIVFVLCAGVMVIRRRREPPGPEAGSEARETVEAW